MPTKTAGPGGAGGRLLPAPGLPAARADRRRRRRRLRRRPGAGDPRLRYIRLDAPHAVGRKRNLALHSARGELICHWDDDDWMASDRLSRQVAALLRQRRRPAARVRCCITGSQAGDAWLYSSPGRGRGRRRHARLPPLGWAAQPFAALEVGEDTASSRRLQRTGCTPSRRPRSTSRCCTRATPRPRTWPTRAGAPAAGRGGAPAGRDRDFYASLRNGRRAPGRARTSRRRDVNLAAHFDVYRLRQHGEYLAIGMQRAGARVDALPLDLARGA